LVPTLKGYGHTFAWPERIAIEPSAGRVLFEGLPKSGGNGLYQDGLVAMTSSDHRPLGPAVDLRPSFKGFHKLARWSQADSFYFFGYALAHYHSVPFTLGEARFLQQARWRDLERLAVELPASLHTHSRRQAFYFDSSGLIRRHDYTAQVLGGWAKGAHFWRDYVVKDRFPVATTRHVVARVGRSPLPFVALHARVDDVRVEQISA
jgi:hypothetical protein